MNYASGQVTTYNKEGAAAARFAFFYYLKKQAFSIADYAIVMYPGEYKFEFDNLPIEVWDRFNAVWVGEDAIYPDQVGCCARLHVHPERTLTYSI